MKKILTFIVAGFFAITLISCNKDEDDAQFLGANVKITVTNLFGTPQVGTTVYMFKDAKPTVSTPPTDAKKQVITDENGVAIFDLNLTELNIFESQTTLYFAVFYTIGNDTYLVDDNGVTVKRSDEKSLSIVIPI